MSGARIATVNTTVWFASPATKSKLASRVCASYATVLAATLALVAVTLVTTTAASPPKSASLALVYAAPAARATAPSSTSATLVGNSKIDSASYSRTVYDCEKLPTESTTVALCCCFSCATNEYTATPASSVASATV